jgi:hypothetical protein
VVKNQKGVFEVDITVCHEDGDYLRLARCSKVEKYRKPLLGLQESLSATKVLILPIVVGTRAAISKDTFSALEKLTKWLYGL